MNIRPLVSIVIPCYDHSEYVQQAIQSIIDQDYDNIELIIIDDGSSDKSVEKIQEMISACEQSFTRFEFRYRPNKGLCATLNEALEWCEGEFFSPLASDDIALPHKTSFLVDKIKDSSHAAVFGLAEQFSNGEKVLKKLGKGGSHHFKDLMFQKSIPAAPAGMLRTASLCKVDGYADDVKLEDWYMWLLLTSNNETLVSFNEIVVLYRSHERNTVKDVEGMYIKRFEVLNKFKKHTEYAEAVTTNYLISARALSVYKTVFPIKLLFKARRVDLGVFFIFIKAVTPSFIIKILNSIKWKC